jgi:hypothetical protein
MAGNREYIKYSEGGDGGITEDYSGFCLRDGAKP